MSKGNTIVEAVVKEPNVKKKRLLKIGIVTSALLVLSMVFSKSKRKLMKEIYGEE